VGAYLGREPPEAITFLSLVFVENATILASLKEEQPVVSIENKTALPSGSALGQR
jgi:hypothetical protein